jgi:hypothetical protein
MEDAFHGPAIERQPPKREPDHGVPLDDPSESLPKKVFVFVIAFVVAFGVAWQIMTAG